MIVTVRIQSSASSIYQDVIPATLAKRSGERWTGFGGKVVCGLVLCQRLDCGNNYFYDFIFYSVKDYKDEAATDFPRIYFSEDKFDPASQRSSFLC
jgi:hypothetical protein